jgi:pilus assembly protein Flp/PilA
MNHVLRVLVSRHGERGATAVEYGLLVALIALVIFGGVYLLGPSLDALFDEVGASL